jgi:hypothetical protein
MFKKSCLLVLVGVAMIGAFQTGEARGQLDPSVRIVQEQRANHEGRISALERDVQLLNEKVKNPQDTGLVLFLFGTVCALWAQNTGRNPWLWFFLGMFFNVVTALVLLYKNAQDRRQRGPDERY